MSSKPHVRHCMEILRAEYSNLFVESPKEWGRRIDAYHGKLRRTETNILESACEAAATRYPNKFPTAGQLLALTIAVEQRLKSDAAKDANEARAAEADANNKASVDELRSYVIPDTAAGQDKWIAEGNTLAERTARSWEVLSKRRNFDPNRPCPNDVAKERWAGLREITNQPSPESA